MYLRIYILLAFINCITSYKLISHPLENRIAYVRGINDIKTIDDKTINKLKADFIRHPLLIFKDIKDVAPEDFIKFTSNFDDDADVEAINQPDKYQHQMLQPFDQFPNCKHVAPRGYINLNDYHNIKNIQIEPYGPFKTNYIWHSDLLAHDYKLLNVVTGFYIVHQPLIGGDTDFISGETVYENLNEREKIACKNILLEINRRKFITDNVKQDYAGINRLEKYEEFEGNNLVPILFAPENDIEKPRILIMPSFFEKVVGWNVDDSRKWIKMFMNKHVLPYRISVQWQKNDLAIFNNRRFIHSSTPAEQYMRNKDSENRLLLQTFIPTKRPLKAFHPSSKEVYECYNCNWISDQEISIKSTHSTINFAQKYKNNDDDETYNYQVLREDNL